MTTVRISRAFSAGANFAAPGGAAIHRVFDVAAADGSLVPVAFSRGEGGSVRLVRPPACEVWVEHDDDTITPRVHLHGEGCGPILLAIPVDGGRGGVYRCRGSGHAVAVYDTNGGGDLIPVPFTAVNDVVQLECAPVGEVRIQVRAGGSGR